MRKEQAAKLAIVGVAACAAVIGLNYAQPQGTALFAVADQDDIDFANFVSHYHKSYGTKEEYNFRL